MPINKSYFLKNIKDRYMIIPTTNNNVNMDKIYNINEIGARIFELLSIDKNTDEIVEILLTEYAIDIDTLKNDVLEFISELKKRGIKKLKVVYSIERPIKPLKDTSLDLGEQDKNKRSIAGSNAFVPPSMGLLIASEVVKDLTGVRNDSKGA